MTDSDYESGIYGLFWPITSQDVCFTLLHTVYVLYTYTATPME